MKAVGLYEYLPIDHPQSLIDVEIEKPAPSGKDLLVNVKAVSVNPVDTKIRQSKNEPETAPKILGWDAAGVTEVLSPINAENLRNAHAKLESGTMFGKIVLKDF